MEKAELEALLIEVRDRLSRLEERLKPQARCYKLPQAAEMMNLHVKTLEKMIGRGEVKTATVGKRQMVPLSEIERVTAPDVDKPKVVAQHRDATWKPSKRLPPPPPKR